MTIFFLGLITLVIIFSGPQNADDFFYWDLKRMCFSQFNHWLQCKYNTTKKLTSDLTTQKASESFLGFTFAYSDGHIKFNITMTKLQLSELTNTIQYNEDLTSGSSPEGDVRDIAFG